MGSLDRRRASAVASALIASIALVPLALPAWIEIPILAFAFAVLPGALLASSIVPGWSRAGRFFAALVLSPFLTGAVALLLMGIGMRAPLAARSVVALVVAAALASAIGRSERERRRMPEGAERERIAWLAAGAWTLLIGAVLLGNRNLIPRSDGWFHASVAMAVLRGSVPPEDPFFAGLGLRDFWGPHAWAAMWPALRPAVGVWAPFVVMNLSGAFATILGIVLLARRIGAKRPGALWAILVAVLGSPPFAWAWIARHAVTGRMPGFAGIERLVSHGLVPTLEAMSRGLLHISMVFFGGKFLVLTPFALGYAAFAAFAIALIDLIEDPGSRRRALALGLFTSAALLIHAVIGLTAVGLAAAWWGWAALRAAFRHDGPARRALLPICLAVAGGALILSPYLATILGGDRRISFGLTRAGIVTWIYGGALVVPAATIWMIRERRRSGPALEMLGLTSILTIPGVALVLSGNNQSKYLNLLFYIASAPAGIAWASLLARLGGIRRWGLIAVLAAATLPTFGLSIWAYSRDPGEFEYATAGESSPVEREAFAWARANTPGSAVFVEEDESRDAAVLAGRSVLWGSDGWARKWGFPEETVRIRKEANAALAEGERLSPQVDAFVSGLGREMIVVARRRDADSPSSSWNAIPRAGGAYRALFSNPEIVLYRYEEGSGIR